MTNRVRLRFLLPETGGAIEGDGEVTWVDSYGRAGVHFASIEGDGQERLEEWLLARAVVGEGREEEGGEGGRPSRPRAAKGPMRVEVVEAEAAEAEERADARTRGIFRGRTQGRLTVVLIRSGKVIVIHGHCEDLSEEGLGGAMDGEFLVGDKVLIELALSEFEEPLRLHAEVRHRSGNYYGFSFVALDPKQRKTIKRISEDLPVR